MWPVETSCFLSNVQGLTGFYRGTTFARGSLMSLTFKQLTQVSFSIWRLSFCDMKPSKWGPKALSLLHLEGRLVCMLYLMDHNLTKPYWICFCWDISFAWTYWANCLQPIFFFFFFFDWNSLHAKLSIYYKALSYKKRSTKRLKHTWNLFRENLQLIGVC